jgi:L-2,4-diaminobutyric acid acetyltransferase
MLQELLLRDVCAEVRHLQTTITPDNEASWGLFSSLARRAGGTLEHETHFCRDRHFAGAHETERMVTITFPEPLRRAA